MPTKPPTITEAEGHAALAVASLALQPIGPSDPADIDALRLGQLVTVQLPPGLLLRNNETGTLFAHATPTPQTVTTTLLRRLRDGDLFLV